MAKIPLWQFGEVRAWAIVDDADAEWLKQYHWLLSNRGYATRRRGTHSRTLSMHREILGLELGDPRQTDHINRDPLDNRRANLRFATDALNRQNQAGRRGTSKHRGVSWDRREGKWRANVVVGRRQVRSGYFDTEEDAAEAAARWRAEVHPFSAEALEVA